MSKIPLVVGVTGHRHLATEDLPRLQAAVTNELQALRTKCPNAPALLLTSLAEGADQLCARAALEAGWDISAALPLPVEEYEKDFSGDALEELRSLISKSREVFLVPGRSGSDSSIQEPSGVLTYPQAYRNHMYMEAGKYVADHCHVLLALWDGAPGRPDGCGTAETAEYAIQQKLPVLQIVTRRAGNAAGNSEGADASAAGSTSAAACSIVWHGSSETLDDILRRTDSFNKDAAAENANAPGADPVTRRTKAVYMAADQMSVDNAVKHHRTIASLSIAATLLTMAFLLYDEAYLSWMILLCLFLLGALFVIRKISGRLGSHRRYLDYRVLAESLRVQGYLRTAGLKTEVAEILPWAVRQDLPWIRRALAVLAIGKTLGAPASIRDIWILDQKHYHEKALKRTEAKAKRNDRIVLAALICMVLTYLITAVFEINWGGLFSEKPDLTPEQLDFWRMILKILMGTLSAATLFAGSYYGSLSLEETAADHRRMIELYARADEQILTRGEDPSLLIELAKEELGENSRWFAYQSMNKPTITF